MKTIWQLDKLSRRQKSSNVHIPPGREMLAITSDTGMFFSILLKAIRAARALEIGTSSGFSTLWIAEALISIRHAPKVKTSIVTIEANRQKVEWAYRNFRDASVEGLITILEGQAIDRLRRLRKSAQRFDFAFIDADKENISDYFELILPMIRVGGIIAVDNMLYPEHFRADMEKYARHVRKNKSVQSVTVPIGNGEEITLKLR
jgi:predicted O-methyltransferase YrrM